MATKTVIAKEKVEVVRQVKLTTNQRLKLVMMSTEGGMARHVDWNVRADLLALGLIEERDCYTEKQKSEIRVQIAGMWKQASVFLKAKDASGLDRIAGEIRSKESEIAWKGFWLTDAANEYLVKGTVTITR